MTRSVMPTMGIVTALAISDDGKVIVVGLYEGKCLFYDVTAEEKKVHEVRKINSIKSSRGKNAKGHKITGLQYIGNTYMCRRTKKRDVDARLLVSTIDSRIRLYRVADMVLLCKFKGHLNTGEAHLAGVTMRSQIRACMSPDMMLVASPSEDGMVYVWSRTPPPSGLFHRRSKDRHSSPLVLNLHSAKRGRQAGPSGDLAPVQTRPSHCFASALAWLPAPAGGLLCEDGTTRVVHRFLLMGTSTGEISMLRVKEQQRVKEQLHIASHGHHAQHPTLAPDHGHGALAADAPANRRGVSRS